MQDSRAALTGGPGVAPKGKITEECEYCREGAYELKLLRRKGLKQDVLPHEGHGVQQMKIYPTSWTAGAALQAAIKER